MQGMAYPKLLSSADILKTAIELLEQGDTAGLSLRAVAARLGVKAPSLYRYFPHKEALEMAVVEEVFSALWMELQSALESPDPARKFRLMASAYLRFARERFPLYALIVQNRTPGKYGSKAGKAVWNLLLEVTSAISGQRDDTAAAVAIWSFLHGYATLEHSGAFGASGPRGGLERGLEAFLGSLRDSVPPVRKQTSPELTHVRRRKKNLTSS